MIIVKFPDEFWTKNLPDLSDWGSEHGYRLWRPYITFSDDKTFVHFNTHYYE